MPKPCDLVFTRLGIEKGCQEEEIRAAIGAADHTQGIPLGSESARTILQSIILQDECEDIAIADPLQSGAAWRYFTLNVDGQPETEVVIAPENGFDSAALPPTDAELLILNAWASGRVAEIEEFKNRVLIRRVGNALDAEAHDALLLAMQCAVPSSSPPILSIASSRNRFEVERDSDLARKPNIYARLVREAMGETTPKWRFLQLYRIFERGYLEAIFRTLQKDFFSSPHPALAAASKATESELEQLKSLIRSSGFEAQFENIHDVLEQLAQNGNRFSVSVLRKAKERGKESKSDKAAASVYAIRCAIAHAGSLDIYYEQYPDANSALIDILPLVEECALQFVGVFAH
jgi:hypothetical protein